MQADNSVDKGKNTCWPRVAMVVALGVALLLGSLLSPSEIQIMGLEETGNEALVSNTKQEEEEAVVAFKSRASLDPEEMQLLSRMIAAEAAGEPYRGMVAVGAVILNRMNSSRFPNTLREVLFQAGQFQPVANGHLWRVTVREKHKEAALEALSGVDPSQGAVFFFAPKKTNNRWVWNRPVILDIGNHRFTR